MTKLRHYLLLAVPTAIVMGIFIALWVAPPVAVWGGGSPAAFPTDSPAISPITRVTLEGPETLLFTPDATGYWVFHLQAEQQAFLQITIETMEFTWLGSNGRQGYYAFKCIHLVAGVAYSIQLRGQASMTLEVYLVDQPVEIPAEAPAADSELALPTPPPSRPGQEIFAHAEPVPVTALTLYQLVDTFLFTPEENKTWIIQGGENMHSISIRDQSGTFRARASISRTIQIPLAAGVTYIIEAQGLIAPCTLVIQPLDMITMPDLHRETDRLLLSPRAFTFTTAEEGVWVIRGQGQYSSMEAAHIRVYDGRGQLVGSTSGVDIIQMRLRPTPGVVYRIYVDFDDVAVDWYDLIVFRLATELPQLPTLATPALLAPALGAETTDTREENEYDEDVPPYQILSEVTQVEITRPMAFSFVPNATGYWLFRVENNRGGLPEIAINTPRWRHISSRDSFYENEKVALVVHLVEGMEYIVEAEQFNHSGGQFTLLVYLVDRFVDLTPRWDEPQGWQSVLTHSFRHTFVEIPSEGGTASIGVEGERDLDGFSFAPDTSGLWLFEAENLMEINVEDSLGNVWAMIGDTEIEPLDDLVRFTVHLVAGQTYRIFAEAYDLEMPLTLTLSHTTQPIPWLTPSMIEDEDFFLDMDDLMPLDAGVTMVTSAHAFSFVPDSTGLWQFDVSQGLDISHRLDRAILLVTDRYLSFISEGIGHWWEPHVLIYLAEGFEYVFLVLEDSLLAQDAETEPEITIAVNAAGLLTVWDVDYELPIPDPIPVPISIPAPPPAPARLCRKLRTCPPKGAH